MTSSISHWRWCGFFLSTALAVLALTPQAHAQTQPFVPGEVIVKFKPGQTPDEIEENVARRENIRETPVVGALQLSVEDALTRAQGEKPPEDKLREIKQTEKRLGVIGQDKIEAAGSADSPLETVYAITARNTQSPQSLERAYEALPEVEYAEPNYTIHAFQASSAPNDPLFSQMWNLHKMNMLEAWGITRGTDQVKVAVVDSGIDYTHPEFGSCTLSQIRNNQCARIAAGWNFANNTDDPLDGFGHGTHVAGTIGAYTNNSVGISGINWNIRLLAIKVLDNSGSGDTLGIIQGIQYAVDNGARVINLSLGGPFPCAWSRTLQVAVSYAVSRRAAVIAAAGNSNTDAANFAPASCTGVITVGATGPDDERASYSSYGSVVDIAAPGGNAQAYGFPNTTANQNCINYNSPLSFLCRIRSTTPNNTYSLYDGTSMAAPHVAGVAALMLSVNPNLTPDQIETLLKNSGDVIATDRAIGGKRLNAYRALLAASLPTATPTPTPASTATNTPTLALNPADINRNGSIDRGDFDIWKCEFVSTTGICANPASNKSADINRDTTVDLIDFNIWRNAYIQ